MDSKQDYLCQNAIGIATNNSGKYTLINLGDGNDEAKGFLEDQNIFLIGNGEKKVNGGNKNDIFVLKGNATIGYINGGNGSDTIDLDKFSQGNRHISVDLVVGQIRYGNDLLKIIDMNRILVRKGKSDIVYTSCSTEHIDGRGGESSEEKDIIIITPFNCAYKLQLMIRFHTAIYNNAPKGDFSYIIPLQEGKASVNLPINSQSNHKFVFNYTLSDIGSIDVKSTNTITVNFVSTLQNGNFNITVLYDKQNTTSYLLSDQTEIKVDEKNNLYALQKSNKPINEIINDYSAIANKLKMYIFAQSQLNNETVAIGHGNHDVLHNNPYHKSHLIGNGGENVFVVNSGYETLDENKLPISEVVIYDVDKENKIDTLDLRKIKQQVIKDLGKEVEARTTVDGQDLLIKLFYQNSNAIESIVKVRLKNTLITNWHERLHVLLDNATMKIEGFDLKPLPLVFVEDTGIIVVKPEDVEKESELVMPRKAGDYVFARSENDLIITNAFDRSLTNEEFCTIVLNDFYQEEKIQTLSIKFIDKEILLKNEMERINNAIALSEQLDQHKNATYISVFNNNITNISNITDHHRKSREVKSYEDQEFFYAQNYATFAIKNDQVASSANKPSSWINDLVGWVKDSIVQWFGKSDSSGQRDQVFFYAQNNASPSIPEVQNQAEDQVFFYAQNNARLSMMPAVENQSVELPAINSEMVNSAAMLANLAVRRYTKEKQGYSVGSFSKDMVMEERVSNIEKSLKEAIYKYQPSTNLNGVSTERSGVRRGY